MQFRLIAGVFFACLAAFSVQAATDDNLLFYCNFDGSANATFSCGDGAAKCAVAPEFQPGVRGKAVVIGGIPTGKQDVNTGEPVQAGKEINCCYAPEKNLDVYRGTVSFWVKPLDWDGTTKGMNVLFFTSPGQNYFQIYKFWSGDALLWLRGKQETWATARHEIGHYWKTGEWHHVAATWSPDEVKLYIDGARVSVDQVKSPFENAEPVTPFSVGPSGSWKGAFIGRSLVDEFRIHDRPLSDEAVIELYRRDSAAVEIESGIVTIGRKTPVLDGKVAHFEYAYSGSGFNDLKGYKSPRQGFYYLSYDMTHLYIAVASKVDKKEQGPAIGRDGDFGTSERAEVYFVTDKKTPFRFVFTPCGGVYDEREGQKQWDSRGVKAVSAMTGDVWTLEAAIPFADLDINDAPDMQKWRMNIGRVFPSPPTAASVAPVKGSLDDRSQFTTLVFRPDAPFIRNAGSTDFVKRQSVSDLSVQATNPLSEIVYNSLSAVPKRNVECTVRTFTEPLYTQGKAMPLWGGVVVRSFGTKFALHQSRILEKLDGKETTLYLGRSIFEDSVPLQVDHLYVQAKKRLVVATKRRDDGIIRARFLKPDGSSALEFSQPLPTDASFFNAFFDLDFEKLVPGLYTIKIDYIAPDGKALEAWEQKIRIPKKDDPMFKPYVDPEADKVPAPWTPVQVTGEAGGLKVEGAGWEKNKEQVQSLRMSVWGRTYDFSKGFLFSSLVSQGKDILAGPAALRLNGQTLSPNQPVTLNTVSNSDVRAACDKTAALGALTVQSRITTHFDGYCEIAMTLAPTGKDQAVRSLSLDIPLRSEAATLVRDSKHAPIVGSKSGAVGDYWNQDFGTRPFVWVGNDRVGFNWCAPSLENWNCRNTAKTIEIIRSNDTAILRFNLVDTPTNWAEAKTIRFGFILTPSRPLDRTILRLREHKDYQMWCQPWHYFAYPDYDLVDRGDIERCGKGVNDVFLYMSDGISSAFMPEWAWWEEEWKGNRFFGFRVNDLFPDPKLRNQHCFVYPTGETWRNFLNNKRQEFFERAKTPLTPKARGYYFDGTGTREQTLNTYRMIRRTGPEAKSYFHLGLLREMSSMHFTDIVCGGEGIGDFVKRDGNYYTTLTPELFRATFSPYIWGMKMVFLDLNVRALKEAFPEKIRVFNLKKPETRRGLLHSYGYCVVHDVDIHDSHKETSELRETIWAAQDKLGWDEKVEFHPYWEQGAVKLASPKSNRIMASAYTKDGKMLLAVVNDTDKEETVRLDLDLAKLGVKEGLKGSDVWQPEATYTLSSSWEGKMPPRAFRLVVWPNSAN